MFVIKQRLRVELRPQKPYLFFGPSFTGKKTMIQSALEEHGFRVLTHSFDEIKKTKLYAADLLGPIAYLVYLDKFQLLEASADCLVIYTTQNPYLWKCKSGQLESSFTLVDLSSELRTVLSVDEELVQCPPWEMLQQLATQSLDYNRRLDMVERGRDSLQILVNNLAVIATNMDVASRICESLSSLDYELYIDGSDEHTKLWAITSIIRESGLSGNERLNWRDRALPSRFQNQRPQVDKTSLDKFNNTAGLHYPGDADGQSKPQLLDTVGEIRKTSQPSHGQRKAPTCRRCQVPTKGHSCPFKTKKPKLND